MKLSHLKPRQLFYFISLVGLLFSSSCITTQNMVTTDTDGIYSDDVSKPKTIFTNKRAFKQYNQNYFKKQLTRLDTFNRNDIITNIDTYTSYDSIQSNNRYKKRITYNAPWGYRRANDLVINLSSYFLLYDPFLNFYYGNNFYNPWGSSRWGYNYGWDFYNNLYYNSYPIGFFDNFGRYMSGYNFPFYDYSHNLYSRYHTTTSRVDYINGYYTYKRSSYKNSANPNYKDQSKRYRGYYNKNNFSTMQNNNMIINRGSPSVRRNYNSNKGGSIYGKGYEKNNNSRRSSR